MAEIKKSRASKRRNTRTIGFNDAEYAEVLKAARKASMPTRAYVLWLVRTRT